MAIPLPAYETPIQGTMNAFNSLDSLIAKMALEKQRQEEANQKNQMFPEDLKKAQLANQYSEQINPLNVEKQQLENQFYTPKTQADILYKQSQNALANQNLQLNPMKFALDQKNALLRQQEINQSANNSFRQWASTPEGQQIITNDPNIAKTVYQSMINDANKVIQSGGSNENYSVPQQNTATQDKMVKAIQEGSEDAYVRTNYPSDIKKRLYAGDRYKATVPQVLENFSKAKVYFSPGGVIQLKKDEASATKDKRVSPSLQAYRKFKQGIEQLNVQGAFLEGVPADQISRGAYNKIYDIDMFLNNPEDAEDTLHNAIQLGLTADEANRSRPGSLIHPGSKDEKIKTMMNKSARNEEDFTKMSDQELMDIINGH